MTQNLPAYLQQYQTPDIGAALSQTLGSAMPPHVSIEGGRFTLIDASNNEIPVPTFDPKIGVYLDACIIDVNNVMSRQYYAKAFDPSSAGAPPDCWSDNGIAPSIAASLPQAKSCTPDPDGIHGCKWAVWGSKINANQKPVPACSQKQKTALLVPGFQTIFLLAVPPNSHSYLRDYVEHCRGHGVNMANLITRISFVPGVQGTLMFKGIDYINEATAQLRQAAYAEKKTDALVGRNDVPRQAALPAPVQTAQPNSNQTGMGDPNRPMPVPQVAMQVPAPQVQQPGPFAGQPFAIPAPAAASPFIPPTTSASAVIAPTDPAPAARRRRRTQAEIAQANGAGSAMPGAPAPAAAPQPGQMPQAPFPHPGAIAPQTPFPPSQQAGALPGQTDMGFGMAQGQPAAANPELTGMLDDFFKQ